MSLRWVALAAAIVGLGVWGVLAASGLPVMPSYLAAWLFAGAVPLGALPLVMGLEFLGVGVGTVLPVLRRMLWLTPVVAVLAIPVALGYGALYSRGAAAMPAWWMSPLPFMVRMGVILVLWCGLAAVFVRAPRGLPRRGLAAVGLSLHLVLVTVAAVDWVMAVDAGLNSTVFGLLVMSAQMGVALAAALFIAAFASEGPLPAQLAPLLGVVLGVWLFLSLTQWLVVWSADLPQEITWYQVRAAGFGGPAIWFGVAATVLTFMAMVPEGLIRVPAVMASVAAMLLLAHMVEMLWLVAPTFRGGFVLAWADVPAFLGLAGLALFVIAPTVKRGRYAAV